ncbi:carbohydrate ABC transporter permease [Glaciimonas sp. GG7]
MKKIIEKIGFGILVLLIVSPAISVFLWMLSLSLKNEVDTLAYPPVFIPTAPTFANFIAVFNGGPFFSYFLNSVIVSGSATLIAITVGVPAAYGITRMKARKMLLTIMVARMTPAISFLIPLFTVFQFLGLTGTLVPIVITHMVITLPISVYIIAGYFETLPRELEEAATMDGCTTWQSFWHVAMPLARPGIMVAAILAFIFSWNNFVFGAVLAGRETRTLPVAIYNVLTFEQIAWGPLAAAALLVTLPVLLLTLFIQKEIVGGLTAGGVKGS